VAGQWRFHPVADLCLSVPRPGLERAGAMVRAAAGGAMAGTVWLVDMGYVVKTAKKSGMRLDYVLARDLLGTRFGETHAFLFNSVDDAFGIPDGLRAFYRAMEAQGMVVRLHPMTGEAAAGTHRQRRVDVDLASHAVWQASLPDTRVIVLTTGDQDLVPAVELCRERFGVFIVLFAFQHDVSRALREAVDDWLCIEDFRDRLAR